MNKYYKFILVSFILFMYGCLSSPDLPEDIYLVNIKGIIVDGTGNPVSGVNLVLNTQPVTTAITDTYGKYSVNKVFPDIYNMTISKPGYSDTTIQIYLNSGETNNINNISISRKATDTLIYMVSIPSGSFMMGYTFATDSNIIVESNQTPVHQVTLSAFSMSRYEIQQKEWKRVMGYNNSTFLGDSLPAYNLNWFEAVIFCNKLSIREGKTPCYKVNNQTNTALWPAVPLYQYSCYLVQCDWNANGYRLPTEAEWEYAAKANTNLKYSGSDDYLEVGWFNLNSGGYIHPVGLKKANNFGLCDLSGNVPEYCWDYNYTYTATSQINPQSNYTVLQYYNISKGGGFQTNRNFVVSKRDISTSYLNYSGFRIVRKNN